MLSGVQITCRNDAKERRVSLGRWLKSLREAEGLSQRELADSLSLEYYTFISQVENGRGKIPVNRYKDWALALNLEPRSFVRELLMYYEPTTFYILFGNES